jgi:membrane protein DedA with SNARE-associated domain
VTMEIALITIVAIAAFMFGALVGFFAGFRFADYLNDRQKLRAYVREREKDRGGDR